jgi:hypothetical protein
MTWLMLAVATFLGPFNVKQQVAGYCYAYRSVPGEFRDGPPGRLTLLALPEKQLPYKERPGFQLVLINRENKTIEFQSEDSRLNIVREARDAAGRWRPIEYLPHSWCGMSYDHNGLEPGRQWSFAAPVYRGTFHTQMRFVLDQPGLHLVSNEFAGTINLEQFTRRRDD